MITSGLGANVEAEMIAGLDTKFSAAIQQVLSLVLTIRMTVILDLAMIAKIVVIFV